MKTNKWLILLVVMLVVLTVLWRIQSTACDPTEPTAHSQSDVVSDPNDNETLPPDTESDSTTTPTDETAVPTEPATEPVDDDVEETHPTETEPVETAKPTDPKPTDPPKDEVETKPTEPPKETDPEETEPPKETDPAVGDDPSETVPEDTKPTEPENTMTFADVNEIVYANTTVNIRSGPGTDYEKLGQLKYGDSITRIGIGDGDWDKVLYNDKIAYVWKSYIQRDKPAQNADTSSYPMVYSDGSCTITIYKEWYKNAYCYAAHLQFSDYSRLGTSCANGKYGGGYETTSHAANRLGAIFAVNGCYSAPNLDYTVVRDGKIWNGADRNCWLPGVYSKNTGLFQSAWESGGTPGIAGVNVRKLVDEGTITDTFCFGPPSLVNGVVLGSNSGARAQRTMIGTNGTPGDIWIVVSDGRYNDGKSAGLTFYEGAEYLKSKGCTFGIHLDGGGSSTMYFRGQVLNAAKGGQRSVVDFVYFK